jgi:hypothetical protein
MTCKNFNINVTGVSDFTILPQIDAGFLPNVISFKLTAGDGVYISLNGVDNHLHLTSEETRLTVSLKLQKIWLKVDGVINPTSVEVFVSSDGSL